MPADQQSLRRTCGRFVIIFISFMTKRAKLASSAFRHYTSKARSAQVQCVLLVTVLLQILLCANDIEMNPGPSESETVTDMKAYMQDLFEHQEVRIQTLLQQQLNVRFGVLENHLTEKIDESMTAVKTEIEDLHAKTCQLENYCCAALQETESTKAAVTELEDRLLKISADLDDKIDRLEVFSRRDNLKFFNVPMSVSNENYADRVDKIVDILSNTVPGKTWCPDDITRAYRLGNSYNNDRAAPVIVTFAKWSDKMAVLTKGRDGLKRKGVRVAGDLTSKQQANIQEQRNRGMHAYYKGNRLVVAGPLQRRPALQRCQHRHSGEQNRRPTEDRRAHSHPGRRTQPSEGSGYRAGDLPRPGTRQHYDRNDMPRDTYGTRQHHDSNKPRSTYDSWQHDDCQNTVWGNYNSDYYYDWSQAYAWQTSMYHFPPLQGHRDTADGHNPDNLQYIPMAQQQQQSTELTDVAHVQSQNSTQDCGARDGVTQGGPVPEVAGDTTDIAQSQASTQECGARDRATRSDPVPEEAGCMTVRETAPPDNQPTDAIQSSAADQNAQRPDFSHDAGSEESDDSAGSEDTMCDNKQPDAAVSDTADTDTEPLTSEIGHPVSEGDTDTEPLTPETETGQPISERDTDTTTRLSDTHVLESPCGSDGPTRRLRSKSVNTAKEKRQLTLLESVSTSVSSGTSNTHKQPTLK